MLRPTARHPSPSCPLERHAPPWQVLSQPPVLTRNHRFTSSSEAALRSAIEPMVTWWYGWLAGKIVCVELALADGPEQVAHAVRFHPQRHVEGGRRHRFKIVGAVERCRPVHVGCASLLEGLEK